MSLKGKLFFFFLMESAKVSKANLKTIVYMEVDCSCAFNCFAGPAGAYTHVHYYSYQTHKILVFLLQISTCMPAVVKYV